MMRGFVYVLANDGLDDLLKIGRTSGNPTARACVLSKHTGVPANFYVVTAVETDDCIFVEREAHEHLWIWRFNERREFFRCSADIAAAAIESAISMLDMDEDQQGDERRRFYLAYELPHREEVIAAGRNLPVDAGAAAMCDA